MKRFKEFLWMFLSFVGLTALAVLYIGLNTSGNVFEIIYQMVNNGFFVYGFLITAIPAVIISVGMTFVYGPLLRKKKGELERRKYYIYLYLISLIMPAFFIVPLFGIVMGAIFSLPIGILAVFVHWVVEWIREKRNGKRNDS